MIRKAQIADVKDIQKLLMTFANRGDMLSRSLSELYESLRDFYVVEEQGLLARLSNLVRTVIEGEGQGRGADRRGGRRHTQCDTNPLRRRRQSERGDSSRTEPSEGPS